MTTLVPTLDGLQYGPAIANRFDYYAASTQRSGGNPWLLVFPHSGYRGGSRYSVRVDGALNNGLMSHFLNVAATSFDVFCADGAQSQPSSDLNFGTTNPPYWFGAGRNAPERSGYFPENIHEAAQCFQFIKSRPTSNRWTNELDPDMGVLAGVSAGATYALLIAMMSSRPYFTPGLAMEGIGRYSATASSIPAAVINRNAQINHRPAEIIQTFFVTLHGLDAWEDAADPSVGGTAGGPYFSDAQYAASSPIDYIKSTSPPTINFYDDTASGGKPYQNLHDKAQGVEFRDALLALGVASEHWEQPAGTPALTLTNRQRAYTFIETQLGL